MALFSVNASWGTPDRAMAVARRKLRGIASGSSASGHRGSRGGLEPVEPWQMCRSRGRWAQHLAQLTGLNIAPQALKPRLAAE